MERDREDGKKEGESVRKGEREGGVGDPRPQALGEEGRGLGREGEEDEEK